MNRRAPLHLLVPLLAAALASFAVVGADCRWLVVLGGRLLDGRLPSSLPFATASTSGWPNVPALGEVVLRVLWRLFGDRGLLAAQMAAAGAAFALLAAGLRREARAPGAVALVSLLVLACSVPAVVVVRNGLFSLALFPLLLLLLEREARRPSRRLWLAVPLLALWTNLHGGVLLGWCVLAAYVLLARRSRDGAGVLVTGALALCLTPVLWRTPDYYLGVSQNEAARRGVALWAPLGTGGFDLVLAGGLVVLLALALLHGRRDWQAWEAVSVLGLTAATLHSARLGTWLAFVVAYPAARALGSRGVSTAPFLVPVLLGAVALAGLVRTPYDSGSRRLAREAAVSGRPVLADALLAEQVALAGGKVWVSDPLDAFRRADQVLYLDWLQGRPSGEPAVMHAGLVLVRRDSAAGRAAERDERLTPIDGDAAAVLYRVVGP